MNHPGIRTPYHCTRRVSPSPSPSLCFQSPQVNHGLTSANLKIVTFGCPRVGNKAFSDDFFSRLPTHVRFVHRRDIVPQVPPRVPSLGESNAFHHIPREVRRLHPTLLRVLVAALCAWLGESNAFHHILRESRCQISELKSKNNSIFVS